VFSEVFIGVPLGTLGMNSQYSDPGFDVMGSIGDGEPLAGFNERAYIKLRTTGGAPMPTPGAVSCMQSPGIHWLEVLSQFVDALL
jgi:hypothetical protein